MRVELWTRSRSLPGTSRGAAQRAESEGWDGITFTDSQNLSGDPYVALATAAAATDRVKLATGVTNPFTRHPAVTASAISCINVESDGRAELGIGRGDSSLAYLGLAPSDLSNFRSYLEQLGALLSGDAVPMEKFSGAGQHASARSLPLDVMPDASRLEWLSAASSSLPRVPVFVVGSGPKVIRAGAELGDRVALAVGADPARVRWAVDLARSVSPEVPISAYVNVVVDDDVDRALSLAAGSVASFARFSAMHGSLNGPAPEGDREVFESIPRAYDMTSHFRSGQQATAVTSDFAERYAVIGPGARCLERLQELAELGVDRFHVMQVSRDVPGDLASAVNRRFVDEVLPALSDP